MIRGCFNLQFMIFQLFASLEACISFFILKLSQLTMTIPEIYVYISIFLIIVSLTIFFVYYFYYRRKRKVFEQIYRKLSDSDKQVFLVVQATEKKSLPTIRNILSVFYNITDRHIEVDQLLQRLYRLENVGLVDISITSVEGQDIQICTSSYSIHSFGNLISERHKIFSSIFLPVSIISLSVCYFLLQFVDLIVHGDLYGYGLVFSYEWANQYWNITALIRSSLNVSLFLLGISLILTIINFRAFKKILRISSCALFIVETGFVSFSVFLLSQLDSIVNSDLYSFGLQFTYQWADKYWLYLGLIYVLFGLSIAAILICFVFCIFSKPITKKIINKNPRLDVYKY